MPTLNKYALRHIIENLSEISKYLDRIKNNPQTDTRYDAIQATICTDAVRRELLIAALDDVEIEPTEIERARDAA